MYWLAINWEKVTLAKLREEIVPKVPLRNLLEVLESLKGQSLIEANEAGFTQQPVIMEYVTERLIETIEQEIITGELNLFKTHALIEAQTQDYVRDAQIGLILHPLTERLLTHFETQPRLEQHLGQLVASLRHKTAMHTGYAAGNLLNLFCQLRDETPAKLTAFSGSFDESIKLWDLQANKCWQTLRAPRPYEGMKIKAVDGLTEAQSATLCALGAFSE